MMKDMYDFTDRTADPSVAGFLHRPESPSGDGLILTHGAGGNAQMPLLVALAETFVDAGITVARIDLPFRQLRRFGPPRPGDAARDRDGLRNAIVAMKKIAPARVFLGGQSYGGRQASMLLAENSGTDENLEAENISLTQSQNEDFSAAQPAEQVAAGLLLLSYPLHPPGRPDQPRIQHLPNLRVPTLFVHGTRDPFGTIEEIENARKLIPAKTDLLVVEGAGHDLGFKLKSRRNELPYAVRERFANFFGTP